MKRIVLALLLASLASYPLRGGVTYEFSSATNGAGQKSSMSGTASVDGPRSRVEFIRGDGFLFPNGSVVITSDGGKTLRILDPKAKTYYTLSFEELFATAGAMMKSMGSMLQLSFANQKTDVKSNGAAEAIEGYPTKKYTIVTSYDMTAKILGSDLSSKVEMKSEIWATPRLSADHATFIQNRGLRTGIEAIDSMIGAGSKSIEGFPLRQVTTVRTTQRGRTDEQTTTVTISKVREGDVAAAAFSIPAGFTEKASPLEGLQKKK